MEKSNVILVLEGKDGTETHEVKYRVPSLACMNALNTLQDAYTKNVIQIQEDSKYTAVKALKEDQFKAEDTILALKMKNDILKANDKFAIEQFKAIIDKKDLPTGFKDVFEKQYTDLFWQNQNIKEIKEAVKFFRSELS